MSVQDDTLPDDGRSSARRWKTSVPATVGIVGIADADHVRAIDEADLVTAAREEGVVGTAMVVEF
jgi:hypothetical protein